MQVIENNYMKPRENKSWSSKRITCPHCKSVLNIEPHDIAHCSGWDHTPLDWSNPYDYVRCPCCNQEIKL